MFGTIKMNFDKLHIKFLNWMNGNGFKIPKPNPKEQCMYNYYKSIVNDEAISPIQAYEDKINELIKKFPEATRKDIAENYVAAMEWMYGKENI